jgi:hypothetical protein
MADPNPTNRDNARPVTVLRVPSTVPTIVRFLGPIRGMITHWPGRGHSIHCPGVNDCPSGVHRLRICWKGYAAVEHWDHASGLWWCRVLEVTEALEEILHKRDLRGEVWILNRQGSKKRNEPVTGLLSERLPSATLRQPFAIEDVLRKVYSVEKLLLDVPNPVPGRLILSASTDPCPLAELDGSPTHERVATPEERAQFARELKRIGFGRGVKGNQQYGQNPRNGDNPESAQH